MAPLAPLPKKGNFQSIAALFSNPSTRTKLILIILLALALRLIFFTGTAAADELEYYRYAHEVTEGTFSIELSHFSFRLGIIYPTALLVSLFGFSELSANAFVLLISMLGIILIFLLGKELFDEKIGLFASFLLAIFPLDVFYATRLLPDIPAAFFMALSVLFFIRAEKGKRANANYLLSGIAWGLAYLMKEISLLLALFYGAYVLYKGKFNFKYSLMAIGPSLAILFIMLISYLHTGDAFFQRHSNQNQEVAFLKDYYPNYFTPEGIFKRVFLYLPYNFLTSIYYGGYFILAFLAILFVALKRRKEAAIPIIWMLSLLAYINFGTISFSEYVPFPLDFRHVDIVQFPAILLISYLLMQFPFRKYLPIILIVLFASSLACIVLLNHTNQAYSIKLADSYLKDIPEKPIYTDERTARILDYLSGFKRSSSITTFHFYDQHAYGKEFKSRGVLPLDNVKDSYIIINKGSIEGLRAMYPDIEFPKEASNPPPAWTLLTTISTHEGVIEIYRTP